MTPTQYAARYLPVMVPMNGQALPINIARYHIGDPTAAKDQLLGALAHHLAVEQKKDPNYRLALTVAGAPFSIGNWREIPGHFVAPFTGKGSPEECELVLQLALRVGGIRPERLQAWADANLGLDCNGFVGNYVFHDVLKKGWQVEARRGEPGPGALIDTIFHWAAGKDEKGALDDLSQVNMHSKYLIARVGTNGVILPGRAIVGHIAVTEPGQIMKQSFVYDSMGGIDPTFAKLGMYNQFAVRTVESTGLRNGDSGLNKYWMVFVSKHKKLKKVFEVRRDRMYRLLDPIKIVPIP